jgi:CHAD domain-containing protein
MILDTHDGLLGDEAQVEARFGPFGDRATLDARLVQGLRQTYHRLRNSIKGTRWNS